VVGYSLPDELDSGRGADRGTVIDRDVKGGGGGDARRAVRAACSRRARLYRTAIKSSRYQHRNNRQKHRVRARCCCCVRGFIFCRCLHICRAWKAAATFAALHTHTSRLAFPCLPWRRARVAYALSGSVSIESTCNKSLRKHQRLISTSIFIERNAQLNSKRRRNARCCSASISGSEKMGWLAVVSAKTPGAPAYQIRCIINIKRR